MQEFQVVFLEVEEGCARAEERVRAEEGGGGGPEDVVVVGEHGEEDAEEEAGCWKGWVLVLGVDCVTLLEVGGRTYGRR